MKTEREILITASGLKRIEEELELLRTVHRRRVAESMREAWAEGNEDEDNIGLEYARNDMAIVEGRIDELRELLASAKIIEEEEINTDEVTIGSVVKVKEMETGDEWDYNIVGSYEADPGKDKISYESPVGKALMGKKPGDMVTVQIPSGRVKYKVVNISR